MGTGFLVGNGVVMTARHVARGLVPDEGARRRHAYTGGRWTSWW